MKKFISFILLLGMVCLAGCKEDQVVSFAVKEMNVGPDATRMNVKIEANCSWTVKDESNMTFTEVKEGTGPKEIIIIVYTNPDYEQKKYTVSITSEDGTSADILTIIQGERFGLEADSSKIVSEEGGTFEIPIKTNDEITSVDTPSWISFTSSRSMTGYTYIFSAEQNKTGSIRNGSIALNGKYKTWNVEVKQDSYAPNSITFREDYSCITKRKFIADFFVEPAYADLSKLSIATSENCKASISDGAVYAEISDFGAFNISFFSDGEEILKYKGEYIPEKPFYYDDIQEAYLGSTGFLRYEHYSSNYILHSSNPDVVAIGEKNRISAVGYGTSMVSVSHPNSTECYDEIWIEVVPFLLDARIGGYTQIPGGAFDVNFAARVEGPRNMAVSGFMIIDPSGYIVMTNNGSISEIDDFTKQITASAIRVNWGGYPNINEALRGYIFVVETVIDGQVHKRSLPINVMNVGF